jgi:hypothetical protein
MGTKATWEGMHVCLDSRRHSPHHWCVSILWVDSPYRLTIAWCPQPRSTQTTVKCHVTDSGTVMKTDCSQCCSADEIWRLYMKAQGPVIRPHIVIPFIQMSIVEELRPRTRAPGQWKGSATGCRVSLGVMAKFWNCAVFAQVCGNPKNHWAVHFRWVSCMTCDF